MGNRCCYWGYLLANWPGEYTTSSELAEGEELRSNLLRRKRRP
jgi:hypothetical protein